MPNRVHVSTLTTRTPKRQEKCTAGTLITRLPDRGPGADHSENLKICYSEEAHSSQEG